MGRTICEVDTLIVGAGVIGSSVAMHLANMGVSNIRVIDFDLEGSLSSSELNAGGVRATWVQPINIDMSKITLDFFATVADEVGYKPCGYLWLHPASRLEYALRARETQIQHGVVVEAWDLQQLKRSVPFLDKTDGIAGAIFAPQDGLINPNLLKSYFRRKSIEKGVIYDDRTLLRQANFTEAGKKKVALLAERFESGLSHQRKVEVLSSCPEMAGTAQVQYLANRVINCAGPWATFISKILGYQSPAYPVRRQVSIFDCREVDLSPYGMIVDTSGVYFHPEATHGLAGFARPNEPHGVNYTYEGEAFFQEYIWPALFERSSYFEKLKHVTGWAGQYEVSPDECAIIGPVSSDKNDILFEAHSFSGHGVMHSYSAGLCLAERIVHGQSKTYDIAPLSASRFESGKLIRENLII